MRKTRIIFFGSSKHSLHTLKALHDHKDYQVVAIVSQPDRPVGRKQVLTPTPVSQFARKYKISLFTPKSHEKKYWLYKKPKKLAQQLAKLKPHLLISAYYGQKIPQEILKLAPLGGLNLHPSLLPKYRGPSPVQWTIYNGEKITGITILEIHEKFDQGEIVAQEKVKINSTDTSETLYARLFLRGAKLLIEILSDYNQGKIKLKKQDKSQASYYPRLKREDGKIDWSKTPQEIDRMIRAFTPWPGNWSWVVFPDKKTETLRALKKAEKAETITSVPSENSVSSVLPKTHPIKRLKILKAYLKYGKLVLDLVQLEGKRPVSFSQFRTAYPNFQLIS